MLMKFFYSHFSKIKTGNILVSIPPDLLLSHWELISYAKTEYENNPLKITFLLDFTCHFLGQRRREIKINPSCEINE